MLSSDLDVELSLENNSFTFWDMILVTEDFNWRMYGRTLCYYRLDSASKDLIVNHKLFTLPYMWYLNASSFDIQDTIYHALIKNFTGKSNSTLDQQLIIADFSQDQQPKITLLPLVTDDVMVQYIAYSTSQQVLYFSGPSKSNSKVGTVGILCQVHGKIHVVGAVPSRRCRQGGSLGSLGALGDWRRDRGSSILHEIG